LNHMTQIPVQTIDPGQGDGEGSLQVHLDPGEPAGEIAEPGGDDRLGDLGHAVVAPKIVVGVELNLHVPLLPRDAVLAGKLPSASLQDVSQPDGGAGSAAPPDRLDTATSLR